MYKIFILAIVLFFSGCTSCSKEKKKESKPIAKQEMKQQKISEKELNTIESTKEQETVKPFKSSIQSKIPQEEIITESLDDLETDALKTIQPHITEEMQKIPDCLEKAETKEEAFDCSKQLRALNKELAIAMGDFRDDAPEGYDDEFVWDEETKVNMIKEIEAGTQAMQEMQSCMEASTTPEALEKCLNP